MTYQTPLHGLPKKAPAYGPYHTALIGRSKSRHTMAGQVLRQALEKTRSALLTPIGPRLSEPTQLSNHKRTLLAQSQQMTTQFNDLTLHVFHDLTAFISRRVNGQDIAYPETLALRTGVYQHPDEKLNLIVCPKHTLYIRGPGHLTAVYPDILERTTTFWAQALEMLPTPTHPYDSNTGFWPAFAPVPPMETNTKETVRHYLTLLAQIIAHTTEYAHLKLVGLTPEADRATRAPKIYLDCGTPNHPPIKQWIQAHLTNPAFPLKGREWLQQVSFGKYRDPNTPLIAEVRIDQTTAHDYIDAIATLKSAFGHIPLPDELRHV